MTMKNLKRELFDICEYIVASAEGLEDEPKDYAPVRLLEVLRRLVKVLQSLSDKDGFWDEILASIDENRGLLMKDREAFYHFLHELTIGFVRERKRRLGSLANDPH